MKVTAYFENTVLDKRDYLKAEWCERVRNDPEFKERQPDGRWRFWGFVPELRQELARRTGKELGDEVGYLRVVTLEDGETIHNAMPDRNYDKKRKRRA